MKDNPSETALQAIRKPVSEGASYLWFADLWLCVTPIIYGPWSIHTLRFFAHYVMSN